MSTNNIYFHGEKRKISTLFLFEKKGALSGAIIRSHLRFFRGFVSDRSIALTPISTVTVI